MPSPKGRVLPAKGRRGTAAPAGRLDFSALVAAIRQAHEQCAAQATRAVNVSLTLRNWVIGWYIREYEQNGADRATYGDTLLEKVADRLNAAGHGELTARYLRLCRQFASVYPEIWQSLTAKSGSAQLPPSIRRSLTAKSRITPSASSPSSGPSQLGASPAVLLKVLSFTHLAELITVEDPLKRAFYEIECIRGHWSVRALKRQIATLYFERSGLSKDKEKLAAMVKAGAEIVEPQLAIRDPYIFEFLGLRAKDAAAESDLEAALVGNLRDFLLELGHGFCLEAQQKSIVIGKTRGFVDLVFYHRILRCHVLVELKVDEFRHEHIGQLNTYVTWYRRHMMTESDNPPVGLLLCTQKDHALVEYALAGIDNRLFVSKYQVELPSKEKLQRFLEEKRRELGGDA
jgi:predicted nuclease of restriction endonuclease-like (RecB) superfamily